MLLSESKKLLLTVKVLLPVYERVYEAVSIADDPFERASFLYLFSLVSSEKSLDYSWKKISPFLKRIRVPNSFGFIEFD